VSNAVTQGIRVTVKTQYLSDRSSPASRQYVFAYTIRITNEGTATAQLKSRHWIITDGEGKVQEVRGDGVVGAQPVLKPGQHFEYTSGCVIATARGTMQGTYQMVRENGERFDAEIAPFALAMPHSLN
jgi:ApaG protein